MNILFISRLTGNLFAGPNNSVPAQIRAQSRYDNVFWYNLNSVKREEWTQNGLDCKNLTDYPTGRLADLPAPFNCPDLVVLEEVYCFPFQKIISDIRKAKIPYIIIPRSQLTEQGQQKNALKKKIANLLFFNAMVRSCAAVQYLTEAEKEDSRKWKCPCIVIPNGAEQQTEIRSAFTPDGIHAVYVGRYERYQKGLDILVAAVAATAAELRKAGFRLDLYGVDQSGTVEAMKQEMQEAGVEDLMIVHDAVYGEEKRKVLLGADVFVMTSRFEGLPMGLIEALSYGIPCIATVGTNLSGVIGEAEAGWIAENTAESVASALRQMVTDYGKAAKIGENARKLADRYTWDGIAKTSHEAYAKYVRK